MENPHLPFLPWEAGRCQGVIAQPLSMACTDYIQGWEIIVAAGSLASPSLAG